LERLARVAESPDSTTPKRLRSIVVEHGRFCTLLSELTKRKRARSFAAKYLHFHCPVVPIYDQRAYDRARKLRPQPWQLEGFSPLEGADPHYSCYVQCFWHVYNSLPCVDAGAKLRLFEVYLGNV